jgi:hypothetical protein
MKNLLRLVSLWPLPLGLPASWAQVVGGSATVRGHVGQAPAGDTVWLEYRGTWAGKPRTFASALVEVLNLYYLLLGHLLTPVFSRSI